jgi:hypothetical protein
LEGIVAGEPLKGLLSGLHALQRNLNPAYPARGGMSSILDIAPWGRRNLQECKERC